MKNLFITALAVSTAFSFQMEYAPQTFACLTLGGIHSLMIETKELKWHKWSSQVIIPNLYIHPEGIHFKNH